MLLLRCVKRSWFCVFFFRGASGFCVLLLRRVNTMGELRRVVPPGVGRRYARCCAVSSVCCAVSSSCCAVSSSCCAVSSVCCAVSSSCCAVSSSCCGASESGAYAATTFCCRAVSQDPPRVARCVGAEWRPGVASEGNPQLRGGAERVRGVVLRRRHADARGLWLDRSGRDASTRIVRPTHRGSHAPRRRRRANVHGAGGDLRGSGANNDGADDRRRGSSVCNGCTRHITRPMWRFQRLHALFGRVSSNTPRRSAAKCAHQALSAIDERAPARRRRHFSSIVRTRSAFWRASSTVGGERAPSSPALGALFVGAHRLWAPFSLELVVPRALSSQLVGSTRLGRRNSSSRVALRVGARRAGRGSGA